MVISVRKHLGIQLSWCCGNNPTTTLPLPSSLLLIICGSGASSILNIKKSSTASSLLQNYSCLYLPLFIWPCLPWLPKTSCPSPSLLYLPGYQTFGLFLLTDAFNSALSSNLLDLWPCLCPQIPDFFASVLTSWLSNSKSRGLPWWHSV